MKANYYSLITIALAAAANALAIPRDGNSGWKVTRFSSSVSPHSTTQITSFYVTRSTNGTAVACSNGTGAILSSTPYLAPVTDGKCADGSGLSFSMRQMAEQAVELTVKEDMAEGGGSSSGGGGHSGIWTSDNHMVERIQSPGSNNPNGQITHYVGPTDFELTMQ